ncbi:MAG: hypothetical protein C0480_03210 [Bradyrhizobium sp.]|jgi:hypothetical protein|nr:hypothetical protein [Bradyrhizobium sp.]
MPYDLDLVNQLCREIGLIARAETDRRVEVDLGRDAVLCFQNAEREEDCLIGFLGTPWHTHDNLMFADARGNYVELDYLNLLTGLKEGRVLVCEREVKGQIVDRWLVHREYSDEFKYLEEDERIIVRRGLHRAMA